MNIFLRKQLKTKCLWIELVRNTIAWCLVPGTGRGITSARYIVEYNISASWNENSVNHVYVNSALNAVSNRKLRC